MGVVSIVILAVAVLAVAYLVMLYSNLVQVKHNVSKAWANIDVLLKQTYLIWGWAHIVILFGAGVLAFVIP